MNKYIVVYSQETRKKFIVFADSIEDAKNAISNDPDSDDGLLEQWVKHGGVESAREATEADEKEHGEFY